LSGHRQVKTSREINLAALLYVNVAAQHRFGRKDDDEVFSKRALPGGDQFAYPSSSRVHDEERFALSPVAPCSRGVRAAPA
jgi:hypothetical protein